MKRQKQHKSKKSNRSFDQPIKEIIVCYKKTQDNKVISTFVPEQIHPSGKLNVNKF